VILTTYDFINWGLVGLFAAGTIFGVLALFAAVIVLRGK
jgi:hypothetical protein